jgi:hypothetical protein
MLSCSDNNDAITNICGIWTLTESEHLNERKSISDDALLEDSKKILEAKQKITLSIFPDNTYTKLCCKGDIYEYGTWKWIKEGERVCFSHQGKNEMYKLKIEVIDDSVYQIELKNRNEIIRFKSQEKLFVNYKEEPFYQANNEWRLKASRKENKQEIINRLGNYFKHITYLLKAADKRDLQIISFEYSMGIIKIYSSGIGIEEDEYTPENWKNIFYDTSQYDEARSIYNNYLKNNNISFPSSSDWVKDDYTIMLSIYNDLKTGKF